MAAPEGYTELGLVGYADKGTYLPDVTYNRYMCVYYEGSTYVALKDGLVGVTPVDGEDWKYLAKGFNETSADGITVTDTSGIIDGTAGKKTILQTFLDKVGDFIINKAITNENFVSKLTERLVNNGTTAEDVTGFALDARQGNPNIEGSLAKQISELNARSLYDIRSSTYIIDGSKITELPLGYGLWLLIIYQGGSWFSYGMYLLNISNQSVGSGYLTICAASQLDLEITIDAGKAIIKNNSIASVKAIIHTAALF